MRWRQTPPEKHQLGSGDPAVADLAGHAPLLLAEVELPDRGHDRPVVADRARLEAPGAEAQRLHGDPGDPDRREQVTIAAPDHDTAPQSVAASPERKRLREDAERDDKKSAKTPAAWITSTGATPSERE